MQQMQKQYRRLEKDEGPVSSKDKFEGAFKNNFYLTEDYASFCSSLTGIKHSQHLVDGNVFYTLRNKCIAINNYDGETKKFFIKNNIKFMNVLNEINSASNKPSAMEYSLLTKRIYEEAKKTYHRSFYDGLNQSKKYNLSFEIYNKYDEEKINEVYSIYLKQISRLKSVPLPRHFFIEFMRLRFSKLFITKYNKEIAAFVFCLQYKDNLYCSIGGTDENYFRQRANNRKYDNLIKYACENNLNLHDGLGIKNTGYQKFKANCGFANYKTERHPNDQFVIGLGKRIIKNKAVLFFLKKYTEKYPRNFLYSIMPLT